MTRTFTEVPRLDINHPKFPEFVARLKEHYSKDKIYTSAFEVRETPGSVHILIHKDREYLKLTGPKYYDNDYRDPYVYLKATTASYFPVQLGIMEVRREFRVLCDVKYEPRAVFSRTTFLTDGKLPDGREIMGTYSQHYLESVAGVILADLFTR